MYNQVKVPVLLLTFFIKVLCATQLKMTQCVTLVIIFFLHVFITRPTICFGGRTAGNVVSQNRRQFKRRMS